MSMQRFSRFAFPVVGVLIILAVWHFYIVLFKVHPVVLPSPASVYEALAQNWSLLLLQSWTTFQECVYGFALAVVVGILIAVVVTSFQYINMMFYPLLIATQSIPKVAIAPLVLIWFGVGMESKVMIAFIVAFFPMVVDTATGLRATPEDLLDLARSLRCSGWQIFWKIQVPSSLPFIFSGAKVAVTLAVIGAVIGEFVGSNSGLGNLVLAATTAVNSPLVWASLVFLSLLGMVLYLGVVMTERLLMPWVEKSHA